MLSGDELNLVDAYWRAANYLSVGQIYLLDNPLLRDALAPEHVKPRLLGHWGTTPGLNLIYAHLNRIISDRDANVIYVTGPGHGGPGLVANAYLEGTYSEVYPGIDQDAEGLRKLFRQFSFPGGIPSHVAAETPGSIHEGGELGYALAHAYGAAFDNPDLVVACVIGDGEAETGPLATSWHSNKFLNPVTDGAVLPILHLNGYKIANPTVLARIPAGRARVVAATATATGRSSVAGDDPANVHQQLAHRARRGVRPDRGDPAGGAAGRRGRPAVVADDRVAHPEGLDRSGGGGRQEGRGHLAGASGAAVRDAHQPGAHGRAGVVAAQLPAGRAVRRRRHAATRNCGRWRRRDAQDERQSARQRRPAAAGPATCRDFADYAVDVDQPGDRRPPRPPGCSAPSCAT